MTELQVDGILVLCFLVGMLQAIRYVRYALAHPESARIWGINPERLAEEEPGLRQLLRFSYWLFPALLFIYLVMYLTKFLHQMSNPAHAVSSPLWEVLVALIVAIFILLPWTIVGVRAISKRTRRRIR